MPVVYLKIPFRVEPLDDAAELTEEQIVKAAIDASCYMDLTDEGLPTWFLNLDYRPYGKIRVSLADDIDAEVCE